LGRIVAKDGQLLKSLGCLMGKNLTPLEEVNFIINKICSRLKIWSNKFLSLANKVILLCHNLGYAYLLPSYSRFLTSWLLQN
jgi:hypothetical protein